MPRPRWKKALRALLLAACAAVAAGVGFLHLLDLLFPFPLQRVKDRLAASPTLVLAADRSVVAWRVDREDNRRLAVRLADVSPWLTEATIAVEDSRFREHPGVDPIAICRATLQNMSSLRRTSGASTITMQTIRLLWQRPRTLRTKLIEAFRAWQLERVATKDEILEIYFNLAPYGGNVIGAEAASRLYFGKGAAHLNLAEASLLAGLPQSPSRLNPLLRPNAALERRNFVLYRLFQEGGIDLSQYRRALKEPLAIVSRDRTIDAPHFAELVLRTSPSGNQSVVTTLVPEMQSRVETLSSRQAGRLSSMGVAGPAVVVLSLKDSSILSYIGNASPRTEAGRLVDAALAPRQPGSLMKPFIFALLAERGKLAPSTRVYDLPAAWANYSPRNMDREWRGELSAADALRQSRNVTAVKQLRDLGAGIFADFLGSAGLQAGRADRDGLALALGVKEQSLLGLTNAYAALGRLGRWLPLRSRADAPAAEGRGIISPEASWLTLSALSAPEEAENPRRVWKTGTSWNQLDAWAVAMSPEYVVGVWCGRLGRGGSSWVAGAEDALPLALEVLDAISPAGRRPSWPAPAGIEFVQVCRDSGESPGWNCPALVRSPVLAANNLMPRCDRHSGVAEEEQVAGPVNQASAGKTESAAQRNEKPRILSPLPGAVYILKDGKEASLPLLAESAPGGELHWFLDGAMLGTVKSGETFDWPMRPGFHRISVGDGKGGTAGFALRVARE